MTTTEKIYEDRRSWTFFEGETPDEIIGIYCRCTHCARFIQRGQMLMNGCGEIFLKKWVCKVHGEVEPHFDRDCFQN